MTPRPLTVAAIQSSRRKQNTFGLLRSISSVLERSDISTEIINLSDYTILPCSGCEQCMRSGSCPLDDDVPHLMERMVQADGVIFSSPVYMGNVTGTCKQFLDRLCVWYHRPVLTGIPVLCASTTAGGSLKYVLKYLERTAVTLGMHPAGRIGRNVRTISEDISSREISEFITHLKTDKSYFRPSVSQIINFNVQKILASAVLKEDEAYWRKQGWLHSPYFYPCSISPAKRIIGSLFHAALAGRIQRGKKRLNR